MAEIKSGAEECYGFVHVSVDDMMAIVEEVIREGKSVKLSPTGKSMLPLLREKRDSVLLSPINGDIKKYDIVLYKRENGGYVLHRVIKCADSYTLIGDNQFYAEDGIAKEQMIAVVREIYREKRSVSVDSFLYRVYSRIWIYSAPVRRFMLRVRRKIGRILHGNGRKKHTHR